MIQVNLSDLNLLISPQHTKNCITLIHKHALVVKAHAESQPVDWATLRKAYDCINDVNDELVDLARIFEVDTYVGGTTTDGTS